MSIIPHTTIFSLPPNAPIIEIPPIDYDPPVPTGSNLLNLPPTLTLGGIPSTSIAIYKPYVDPGATATDALGRSLMVTVVGLPGSASNFTATITNQPIIVTYTASDAASQSVTGIRSLTVYDPCGPAEKTCSSITFACSINGNCGAAAASLTALLLGSVGDGSMSSSSSSAMTGSISANAVAVVTAAAATALLFATPDVTPPVITILGAGQPFVTTTGSSGLITSLAVGGGTYVDPGAKAIKVRTNPLLPIIDLSNSFVSTGADAVITAAPTLPSKPFVISYNVRDNAVPPNSAVTVHRRVQVLCKGDEVVCTNDDGTLSCSYGGICCQGAAAVPAAMAEATIPASASAVDQGYRRGVFVVRRTPVGVLILAEALRRAKSLRKAFDFGSMAPASRSKLGEAAPSRPRLPRFVRTPAGFYTPLIYDFIYSHLIYNTMVPVLSLNGPTPITVSAGQPYAPCLGMMTSNCEMGATATLSTTGDFDSRISACADLVRPQFVSCHPSAREPACTMNSPVSFQCVCLSSYQYAPMLATTVH